MWPFHFNGKQYNKPSIKGNKCTVNDVDFLKTIMECPELFAYIMDNKGQVNPLLIQYIENVSEPFEPAYPMGTIGRVKVPATEWQDEENHRYVRLDLIHCANYNNTLLPFHDAESQYGWFFINISQSIRNNAIELYFVRENDEPSETDEEHTWMNYDMVDTIYVPKADDDKKDEVIGFKDLQIEFLKRVNNAKVDELIGLENETVSLLLSRLRAKIRNGKQGTIVVVQGITQQSLWDSTEEKLEDITDPDDDYSSNPNIVSFKLSRHETFGDFKINPIYLVKVYDEYGKEMKLIKNTKNAPLYSQYTSYTKSVKALLLQISKKYLKSGRICDTIHCFNGLRISFNSSTRAFILKTNNFKSSVTVDTDKNKVTISNVLGRNGGW